MLSGKTKAQRYATVIGYFFNYESKLKYFLVPP